LHAAKNFGIGHLIHINQPDSQMPPKPCEDFLSVQDFSPLLAGLQGSGPND
jgi:5'-nucleotidase